MFIRIISNRKKIVQIILYDLLYLFTTRKMRSLKFHDSFFVFLTKVEFKIQIELYHVTISCPNAFKIQKKIIIDLNYQSKFSLDREIVRSNDHTR